MNRKERRKMVNSRAMIQVYLNEGGPMKENPFTDIKMANQFVRAYRYYRIRYEEQELIKKQIGL